MTRRHHAQILLLLLVTGFTFCQSSGRASAAMASYHWAALADANTTFGNDVAAGTSLTTARLTRTSTFASPVQQARSTRCKEIKQASYFLDVTMLRQLHASSLRRLLHIPAKVRLTFKTKPISRKQPEYPKVQRTVDIFLFGQKAVCDVLQWRPRKTSVGAEQDCHDWRIQKIFLNGAGCR